MQASDLPPPQEVAQLIESNERFGPLLIEECKKAELDELRFVLLHCDVSEAPDGGYYFSPTIRAMNRTELEELLDTNKREADLVRWSERIIKAANNPIGSITVGVILAMDSSSALQVLKRTVMTMPPADSPEKPS